MKNRGQAMGAEHAGKGVDVQLGPVAGPIGRVPEGGRNWEGMDWQNWTSMIVLVLTLGKASVLIQSLLVLA